MSTRRATGRAYLAPGRRPGGSRVPGMPADQFDVVVLGAGPGGRHAAQALAAGGMAVAVVEQELVGGECPFWACIPSKTLLRPVEVRAEAAHVRRPGVDARAALGRGPRVPRVHELAASTTRRRPRSSRTQGIEVVRGPRAAWTPAAAAVRVGDRTLRTERVVVATGTTTALPPVDGLADVPFWTNREATTLREVPAERGRARRRARRRRAHADARPLRQRGHAGRARRRARCRATRRSRARTSRRALRGRRRHHPRRRGREGRGGPPRRRRRRGPLRGRRRPSARRAARGHGPQPARRRPRPRGGRACAPSDGAIAVDDHLRAADGHLGGGRRHRRRAVHPRRRLPGAHRRRRHPRAHRPGRLPRHPARGVQRPRGRRPSATARRTLRAEGIELVSHEVELSATRPHRDLRQGPARRPRRARRPGATGPAGRHGRRPAGLRVDPHPGAGDPRRDPGRGRAPMRSSSSRRSASSWRPPVRGLEL